MKIYNEEDRLITEEEADLAKGYLIQTFRIKDDVIPIDNETKFAYADEDYEEILRYVVRAEPAQTFTPQDDVDSMIVDHEYRLTVLELGLSPEGGE